MSTSASEVKEALPAKFGTFGGVFTPNVLTILGVIMFLRFGQITGQAGVFHALLILACAKLITSLTAVSLAAIATNTRVKGGGAYYLISRSLGVEFGGGIAFVFYLAQAVSVAMYVIGFAEAFIIESLAQAVRSAGFFIPASLGVQEGGYLLFGTLMGLSPEVALALSLVRRVRQLLVGVPALLAWQVYEGRRIVVARQNSSSSER